MGEVAVRVAGLARRFGRTVALAGVDLQVEAGTIYGLVGPNGAGKTTLIRSLVGVVRPGAGSVEVLGKAVPDEVQSVRPRIGYMPQVPALYGDLTVRANVAFFARAQRVEPLERRVEEVVAFCGLESRRDRRVDSLSSGLKQRCSLACALVHRPGLLILDEPTAGVDPLLKAEFWRFFRELAAEGKTVLIATHLMDEPLACDRVGILREGVLLAEDTPAGLLARGRTRVTLRTPGGEEVREVGDMETELPAILAPFGLKGVERITVEPESLEQVLLRMIGP